MSEGLWSATEAAAATGGRAAGSWTATGVSIDSRTVEPGDLFVPLKSVRDGHGFVAEALSKNAAASMIARPVSGLDQGAPLLWVEDCQRALEALGEAARKRTDARIAGVTGSVGKTTTKEMLRVMLGEQAPTHASNASYNNHWGVPLSLARMPAATRFGVFEMGMNRAGEIAALTRQVRPHAALVTWVAAAHLAFFDDESGIAHAKAEIFGGLEQGGTAILPFDNRHRRILEDAARAARAERIVSFGRDADATVTLKSYEPDGEGARATIDLDGRTLAYRLGIAGVHHALNSAAALAVVEALGADVEAAAASLGGLTPGKGRGARHRIAIEGGSITLLDESYNANPASMAAAIELLGSLAGRRIVVLGDMLELGRDSRAFHAGLAAPIDQAGVALVFACGDAMEHLFKAVAADRRGAHAERSADLIEPLRRALAPGDVVLVKGSLGSAMGPIVDALLRETLVPTSGAIA